jgi:hypothetical protein
MLRQLKRDGNRGGEIDRSSVACGGAEADLLGDAASFFVESVTKAAHDALHDDLAVCQEGNAQHNVTLDLELAGFAGVLHSWF